VCPALLNAVHPRGAITNQEERRWSFASVYGKLRLGSGWVREIPKGDLRMNWKVLSQLFLTVVLGLILLDLALEDSSSRIAIGSKVKLSRKELAEAVVLATTLNAPEIEPSF